MKNIFLYGSVLLLLLATSCDKWLDVKPQNQKTTEELLSTYSGFCHALNGCYIKLKDRDIYGEILTMGTIESMGQLWQEDINIYHKADYELMTFDYDGDNAKEVVEAIYSNLYNTIAHANMIINNMEEYGSSIEDESVRAVIEGEAYAIRAFCHFDVLRLFGQVPNNATIMVSLPYAEVVSSSELPAYYAFDDFVAKIEADLEQAESLLENNDPVFTYTFDELNSPGDIEDEDASFDGDFLGYRQNHFNYWAVKALKARFYLYTGNTSQAYTIAKSIINAIGVGGNPLIALSTSDDFLNGYYASPSECLMMLNAYDIATYSPEVLATGSSIMSTAYYLFEDQLDELFEGQVIVSDARYLNLWDDNLLNMHGDASLTLAKYYSEEDISYKTQVIPLLRLSEMYLIVMETTTDLSEANTLWAEYQLARNVLFGSDAFASLTELKEAIPGEYRREFFGEGQMFYTYKRLGATSMLWGSDNVIESNYIVPLPDSEYDPNL